MVDANLTYLDSLNRYIVLCSYKALTGLSEKRLVSTKPNKTYREPDDTTDFAGSRLVCYLLSDTEIISGVIRYN